LTPRKARVCAVSFLNTAPLVHGLVHGPQAGCVDLDFAVPSLCADRLRSGEADVGLVPVIEMERQHLTPVDGIGIACHDAVRSILLISRVPYARIRRLAADTNSRTSVELSRVILDRRYGARPELIPMAPRLDGMLAAADAALVIGDTALELDIDQTGLPTLDLGREWCDLTGLPFVFAMWAGPADRMTPELMRVLTESGEYGLAHLDVVVREQATKLPFSPALIAEYFRKNIVYRLGARERAGLALYLRYVRELDAPALAGLAQRES
jgi:predicted solute-binding protein